MRILSMVVILLGLVSLVFGILFIVNAGTAKNEVAESLAPLTLDELDARYEQVKTRHNEIRAAEEPAIQAGTAAPSATYNYLSVQRASLGLARTNVGLSQLTQTAGIINMIVGAGLALTGILMLRRPE